MTSFASTSSKEFIGQTGVYSLMGELGWGYGRNVCRDRNGNLFVIKLWYSHTRQSREVDVLSTAALKKCHHFAQFYDQSLPASKKPFVIMERLGSNLETTCLRVAIQTLNSIEELHYCGFFSRDIKPTNFVCGYRFPQTGIVYIIDFELALRFLDKDGNPASNRDLRRYTRGGTTEFKSLSQHRQQPPLPLDDLESWFYTVLYLFNNDLSWFKYGKKFRNKTYEAKLALRNQTDISRNFPEMMAEILRTIDQFPRNESPDFDKIYCFLERRMRDGGYTYEQEYDWETLHRIKIPYGLPPHGIGYEAKRVHHKMNASDQCYN
uniref:Protein kinase domain-containing protein n=1 Tax=Ditylenchus dipsaci TaxID=166011 RepID=A0A915DY15_9BILA